MKGTRWLPAIAAPILALCLGAAAPAAQLTAAPKIKVVGFAAIFDNDKHVVHAKDGGVLRRCPQPRAFAVVADVSNIKRNSPYLINWRLPGKLVYQSQGKSGSFGAKATRVELSFRKQSRLPNGLYTFEFYVSGKLLARATVKRKC